MKSEKAKLLLRQALTRNEHLCTGMVTFEQASNAAEIAELEAEERVRAELTRWRDPVLDTPPVGVNALIKTTDWVDTFIYIGFFDGDVWRVTGWEIFTTEAPSSLDFDGVVIGWREIHE